MDNNERLPDNGVSEYCPARAHSVYGKRIVLKKLAALCFLIVSLSYGVQLWHEQHPAPPKGVHFYRHIRWDGTVVTRWEPYHPAPAPHSYLLDGPDRSKERAGVTEKLHRPAFWVSLVFGIGVFLWFTRQVRRGKKP